MRSRPPSGYGNWLHGEAVAAGMVIAADMSARLGWLQPADRDAGRAAARAVSAAVAAAAHRRATRARELMGMDKKVLDGRIRLVLLRELGRATSSTTIRRAGARRYAAGAFRLSTRLQRMTADARTLAPYAAADGRIARPRAPRAAARAVAASTSATAIASSIPPPSAGWSTRPRCSSITKAICIAPG